MMVKEAIQESDSITKIDEIAEIVKEITIKRIIGEIQEIVAAAVRTMVEEGDQSLDLAPEIVIEAIIFVGSDR
jgi:formaldehyde-activating enzyme involved in methanogenesis